VKEEIESFREKKMKDRFTVSFLAIHKNYTIEELTKDIDYFRTLETSKWLKIHSIAIVPECYREFIITEKKKLPFSFNFIINCISR